MKEEMIFSMDKFDRAKSYWLDKLSGKLSEVNLVTDFPGVGHYTPAKQKIHFEKNLTGKIMLTCKGNNLSIYIILVTAFKILLQKYTGQNDIIISSPVYNVTSQEYNQFVILRDFVHSKMTFKELLMKVKLTIVDAYKNQFYPIKKIIDFLGIGDGMSLFKFILFLEKIHQKELVHDVIKEFANDMILAINAADGELAGEVRYNSELFYPETIRKMMACYKLVLNQVLDNTDITISSIELTSPGEREQILYDFNNTRTDYPTGKTVHELFKQQVEKNPDKIAVRSPIDLSGIYEELKAKTLNAALFIQLEKCCFKVDPYIFQYDLNLAGAGIKFYILKTRHHNSVVVNSTMMNLLRLFTGDRTVKSIFSQIKHLHLNLLIYSVNADDVLEISNKFSNKQEIYLRGGFDNFIRAVKALYNDHLIDLTGFAPSGSEARELHLDYFAENEPLVDKRFLDPGLLHEKKKVEKADVLILGDTPGLSTTGVLYLASYLRRNGIKAYCQFSDSSWDMDSLEKNIEGLLRMIQPRVVAISMKWFLHVARVLEICKRVKAYSPQIQVVVGGNTASIYWEEVIRYDCIDYVVRGDGELPLLKICRGETNIPNCIYKKDGNVTANPITYLHDETNAADIYLSHMDEILLSDYASIFGIFFIYTQRGCLMNCTYCGGCNKVQRDTFNRKNLFVRDPEQVRKDILAVKPYASTIKFLFDDYSNENLLEYCKKIWEGIDLTSHFCFITNVIPPSPQLLEYVNKTFKYVYWNLDLCSLSQRHREHLYSLKLVKPQPSDEDILGFFDRCEAYDNAELIINLVVGLPYFNLEDIAQSEKLLAHIMNTYSCFSELFWARLHAQPGAPIIKNVREYDMYSLASTFEEFLHISKKNLEENVYYPNVDTFYYPYIYFVDDELNSRVSRYYSETNLKIMGYRENKRKKLIAYESLTYRQLNEKTHQLALVLQEKGVKPGTFVGIMVDRSLEMIVGLLGILESGGAYLPVDPVYPRERITYMLADCNADLLLTQQHLLNTFPFNGDCLNLEDKNLYLSRPGNLKNISGPGDPAYIIFTSGSTGKPKGVVIRHGSIVNTLHWRKRCYQFNDHDTVLQIPSFSFDSSVEDIFTPLVSGSKVLLIQQHQRFNLDYLGQIMKREHVTHFLIVPNFYRTFLQEISASLKMLRSVTLAGENFTDDLVEKHFEILEKVKLYNEYGPTENSVCTTVYEFKPRKTEVIIGKPINNVSCYILGEHNQLNPIGVPGELCISGVGLARGYLNRVELTGEKFIPNPFINGERMYKTGDRAKWLSDGNIKFLGRMDEQLKIRGFRIEPEEIEKQLITHREIKEAVVIAIDRNPGDQGGEKQLCAYIVSEQTFEKSQVKEFLATRIPDYMIPAYVVTLDKIPLTPNGKINRKALPDPGTIDTGSSYTAPRNPVEEKLVEIWAEVLDVEKEKIGIDSNFFELGGHSLKATIMILKIHRTINSKLELMDIFKKPTIRGLAESIESRGEDRFMSLEPVGPSDYYVLSSAQKRLYVSQQLDETSTVYNMVSAVILEGDIDANKLENTFKALIARHEGLRASFEIRDNEPVQKINPAAEFKIEYWEGKKNDIETGRVVENFVRPFDLSRAPLFRVGVIKADEQRHVMIVDIHHIVSDGISQLILIREFMALYAGETLPRLKFQYKDYSHWQWKSKFDNNIKKVIKKQEEYWLTLFREGIPRLDLQTDFVRSGICRYEGKEIRFEIGEEEARALNKIALMEGTTLYMVLLAITNVLLFKICGQEDIVVGTVVDGRRHPDVENIIGMFVNTLALRNFPQPGKTFREFLKDVNERTLEAFANQDYQFEDLVEQLEVTREPGRNPLFDFMLVLQNIEIPEVQLPGLILTPYSFATQTAKFDLTFMAVERENKLDLLFEYCTSLFKKETILRFTGYFKKLVDAVTREPYQEILGIDIIDDEEKRRLLYDFNDTWAEYPRDKTIHQLFEEQVERIPDHIALVGKEEGGKGNVLLTYRELNEKSRQLAYLLKEKGVKPDTIVGIMVEPSQEIIVGLLGILEASGAYLPIDPEYPVERIKYTLEDSSVGILLTTLDLSGEITFGKEILNLLDAINPIPTPHLHLTPFVNAPVTSLAYVIYTSGTTGKPKGMMIQHKNVVRLMFNDKFQFDFSDNDVWTLFHSFCFDFSVWEMYGALLYGGKLILIPRMEARDPSLYLQTLKKHQVTILNQTPSVFYALSASELTNTGKHLNLRYVIFGGEALNPAQLKKWQEKYPTALLINMYGITETTVHVTYKEISLKDMDQGISNIGQPIPTLTVYVVDKNMQLVPIGVPGECCVGGEGVGRGYLNHPEMTSARFIKHKLEITKYTSQNPNRKETDARIHMSPMSSNILIVSYIYKTGDLVRRLPHGDLEYLGRIDHQVKIRGFRIELGEIESKLKEYEAVKEAVVIAREDYSGDRFLCAYVITDGNMDKAAIKAHLAESLPEYMIPAYFLELETIPLTVNGKIDRKALKQKEININFTQEYIKPRDKVEEKLVEIWSAVLGIEKNKVSINSNFFEQGGHSLKATVLAATIYKELKVKLSLAEIFKVPLVMELAQYIKQAAKDSSTNIEKAEKKEYYVLSPAQKGLYFIQTFDPGSISFNIPQVLLLEGTLEIQKFEAAFKKLIHRHESLRTSFETAADQPVQRIHDNVNFHLQYCETSESEAKEILKDFLKPFDLGKVPLMRVKLIKIGMNRHILMVDIHHIVSDAISQDIFMKDFITSYIGGEPPQLPIHYKDFSEWQDKLNKSGVLKKQEAYWLNRFKDEIPVLNMNTDYPRPLLKRFDGGCIDFEIGSGLSDSLRRFITETRVTMYIFLLAVYTIVLSKYSGQEDIVVGSPFSSRTHVNLYNIIGLLVNMLPIRNSVNDDMTFSQFLMEVKGNALDAFENQDYQFTELVRNLNTQKDMSRHPLFDNVFALNNMMGDETIKNLNFKVSGYMQPHVVLKFDLLLDAFDNGEGAISMSLSYAKSLYKQSTVEIIARHYLEILEKAMEERDAKIKKITLSHDLLAAESINPQSKEFSFSF